MPATTQQPALQPALLSQMAAAADPTRARLLRVLERSELTVAELCSVLQLPQSTASRHLKVLAGQQWVVSRREGTATLYRLMLDDLSPETRKLWLLIREQATATRTAERDDARLEKVLAERQTRSQAFFSSAAGQWDRMRTELFGEKFDLASIAGLLDPDWVVGDLGCGTGQMAEAIAPFVEGVVAVDSSAPMLKAARHRLANFDNVRVERGTVTSLPIDDEALNAATVTLVLHHLPEPAAALREIARTLRSGGRLLIVDMLPHDRAEFQQTMGHQWLGIGEAQLGDWMTEAGLTLATYRPLPVETDTKGPPLFAATGTRQSPMTT